MNKFKVILLTISMTQVIFADADTRTVNAEYERCHANMERYEREVRRYDDAIDRLNDAITGLTTDERNDPARELTTLENQQEYFHNRFERFRSQSEKLRDDLKNVGGPTCPSCIQSSVNLYCRMIETVQNELDDYMVKTSDLQQRIRGNGSKNTALSPEKNVGRVFKTRRLTIDSLYQSTAECSSTAAKTLHHQVKMTLGRADSLDHCNQSAAALKSLDIAGALLSKAAERCSEGK